VYSYLTTFSIVVNFCQILSILSIFQIYQIYRIFLLFFFFSFPPLFTGYRRLPWVTHGYRLLSCLFLSSSSLVFSFLSLEQNHRNQRNLICPPFSFLCLFFSFPFSFPFLFFFYTTPTPPTLQMSLAQPQTSNI
jgi:hypothetical protein